MSEENSSPYPEQIVKNLNDSIVMLLTMMCPMKRRLSILVALNDVKSAKRKLKGNQEQGGTETGYLARVIVVTINTNIQT